MRKFARSLVPLRKEEGVSDTALAPFEQFVAGLYERRMDDAVTMAGSARWSAFPIEHAIADGLWPVLLRVAEKLGRGILTERQVVQDIAPRVDRLVNAGLVLVYPSIDGACSAFLREVIDPIYAANRGKSGSASDMLQDAWQRPVAKFFATLIRAAQGYGDEIGRMLALLHKDNIADVNSGITFIDSSTVLKFELLRPFLRLESDSATLPSYEEGGPYQFLRDALRKLEQIRTHQVALMRLPLRLHALPSELTSVASSVDYPWIRTQLLLAAADLPDREYLLGDEFVYAAEAVGARDDNVIVASFFKRMTARGMVTDTALGTHLGALVLDHLFSLKRAFNKEVTLDFEFLATLFMVVKPEHLTFDRDTAIHVALGTEIVTENLLESMSASAQVDYWRRHVMPAIVWETLTIDDVQAMASRGPLPLSLLAEGVAKMDPEKRARAVEWLLEADIMPSDAIVYLIEQGVITPTTDFLASHYRKVPAKLLAEYLSAVLEAVGGETRMAAALSPAVMLSMFDHIPHRDARKMVDNPWVREPLVAHVMTEIVDPDHRVACGITKAKHEQFVRQIGKDRWYHLVLALEISMREEEYVGGSERELGVIMARWDDLPGRLVASHNLPGWLGLKPKRAQKVLRTHAEDDMFAWLYAAREDLPTRLAAYRAARDRYYK